MLTSRLTDCTECGNILQMIAEIDCKITNLSKAAYNKIVFALNTQCKSETMGALLHYRRILVHKYCNPEYVSKFTMPMIQSKVKILILK
jgi:hypothetical protein